MSIFIISILCPIKLPSKAPPYLLICPDNRLKFWRMPELPIIRDRKTCQRITPLQDIKRMYHTSPLPARTHDTFLFFSALSTIFTPYVLRVSHKLFFCYFLPKVTLLKYFSIQLRIRISAAQVVASLIWLRVPEK